MGTLYIVPTPIGNLEDMTLRALRVLKSVRLIAAEDTRHSHKLTSHFEIDTPMTSYFEHNKLRKLPFILGALDSGDVALISDAGTPGISDPGYELIRAAIEQGVEVVVLPGPNAIFTGLSVSGLNTAPFRFYGFLPRKEKQMRDFLDALADYPETLVFYESPNRLLKTLQLMLDSLGNRQAVVAVEMTKMFEEFQRAPLSDLIAFYDANPLRGEVTLMVSGKIDDE
ncbi:MAG: 16S rRNA (cytidine(1402)-2'-O)-methyltransferase [Anaerolineae bacterium]